MDLFFKPLAGTLTGFDLAVVFAAVAVLFVIAYITGRREKDTGDFFLGNRRVPAIIACFSFVATEVSAVTITSVPATAYSENWQYLQFFVGSAAARVFVAFAFIPLFYKYNCTSIYEFLRHRFNPQTQYAGSACFFITRTIGAGVRLYAACLAISVIMNCSLAQSLIMFTIISMAFIAFGGIKAVVWAGAYISLIFFAAGISLIIYLLTTLSSATNAWHLAGEAGRLSVFNFSFALNNPTTFWAGTANAFFICLAVFGTDQELVQRLLTVKTRKSSQKAIIATTFASLPMLCIYLTLGTLLFVFYKTHPGVLQPSQTKTVISDFVVNIAPAGLKGLFLTAIVMASVDLPLASLSSSFISDIYRPLINRNASEKHYLMVSRLGVIAFGLILATIAFACQPITSILWFAFKVVSVTGGATLGIFLFGTFFKDVTTRGKLISLAVLFAMVPFVVLPATDHRFYLEKMLCVWSGLALLLLSWRLWLSRFPQLSNVFAMTVSVLSMASVLVLSQMQYISLAWSWLIVIGTLETFCLAYLLTCGTGILPVVLPHVHTASKSNLQSSIKS